MIFVDASAMTAVIGQEEASERILDCLESGARLFTSPIAIYETALAIARIANFTVSEALSEVNTFVERAGIQIEPIDREQAEGALGAFARFGRGHHKAALNMGDCFAYASAKARNAALLFIGDGFSKTDIKDATPRT